MRLAPCVNIFQYKDGEFITQWNSIKEAGETLGIFATNIVSCAKGKVKSAGGFVWKYQLDKI